MLEFIFQNSNMKFDNEFFNEIKGTATGTIFAPTYGALSVRYSEIKLNNNCNLTYGKFFTDYIKEN